MRNIQEYWDHIQGLCVDLIHKSIAKTISVNESFCVYLSTTWTDGIIIRKYSPVSLLFSITGVYIDKVKTQWLDLTVPQVWLSVRIIHFLTLTLQAEWIQRRSVWAVSVLRVWQYRSWLCVLHLCSIGTGCFAFSKSFQWQIITHRDETEL